MADLLGPAIVLALGGIAGVFANLLWRRFWAASVVAAFLATILWGGGCYLLFALTAPNELGPLQWGPVLLTAAIALVGALIGDGWMRIIRSDGRA